MVEIEGWMQALTERLREVFADRLLFTGLQGSYRRGEAGKDSDIDAVVILDTLSVEDLERYKKILATMPDCDRSCGFVGGRREIQNWPRHELFQFARDTRPFYGSLDGLLPQVGREDIIDSVRIGASGIYHMACHACVHAGHEQLKGLYKGAFFLLQAVCYLRYGSYCGSKKELLALLAGSEREILLASMEWEARREEIAAGPDAYFERLIQWSASLLEERF